MLYFVSKSKIYVCNDSTWGWGLMKTPHIVVSVTNEILSLYGLLGKIHTRVSHMYSNTKCSTFPTFITSKLSNVVEENVLIE